LQKLDASDNWLDGIRIHKGCSDVMVEGCSVGDCNQDWNPDNRPSPDSTTSWSASLVIFKSENCTLKGNRVYECYGEGINNLESNHSVIEDNIVYDNAKVNIYSDRTKFPVIRRNLVYMTGNKRFWRHAGDTPATPTPGIVVNDEASDNTSTGQVIINNFIYNCGTGFGIWGLDQTDSLLFANNTIVNTMPGPSGDACVGINIAGHVGIAASLITNNIVCNENKGVLVDGPTDGVTFSHNNWGDSVGRAYAGTGDVVGNPDLKMAGDTGSGNLSADFFRLASSSPAIDAAEPLGEVTEDFFRTKRGDSPDIGACEYQLRGGH
jgi:parallel beta-helix repeat protein